MTYASYHQSNEDSREISLYLFRWGNTEWAYCTGGPVRTYGGATYTPIPIQEERFVQGGRSIAEFTFSVPANLPVVQMFRGTPPSEPITVTVRSMEVDDDSGEAPIRWIGPISNVRFKEGDNSAEVLSRINGLRRGGLRLTWGRGCQHFVYGPGCNVDKSLHANARTITAIAGNVLTLSSPRPSAGYFNGGFMEWDADGLGTLERRAIEVEVTEDQVKLFGRADGLTVGQAVTIYPGCPRTSAVCQSRFNNLPNYDGLDFMPGKSPFDGKAVA